MIACGQIEFFMETQKQATKARKGKNGIFNAKKEGDIKPELERESKMFLEKSAEHVKNGVKTKLTRQQAVQSEEAKVCYFYFFWEKNIERLSVIRYL